jgi:hypothetical protein
MILRHESLGCLAKLQTVITWNRMIKMKNVASGDWQSSIYLRASQDNSWIQIIERHFFQMKADAEKSQST